MVVLSSNRNSHSLCSLGLAVGDENPVCINWDTKDGNEDTAKLQFMAKFQGTAEINRLKITGKNTSEFLE